MQCEERMSGRRQHRHGGGPDDDGDDDKMSPKKPQIHHDTILEGKQTTPAVVVSKTRILEEIKTVAEPSSLAYASYHAEAVYSGPNVIQSGEKNLEKQSKSSENSPPRRKSQQESPKQRSTSCRLRQPEVLVEEEESNIHLRRPTYNRMCSSGSEETSDDDEFTRPGAIRVGSNDTETATTTILTSTADQQSQSTSQPPIAVPIEAELAPEGRTGQSERNIPFARGTVVQPTPKVCGLSRFKAFLIGAIFFAILITGIIVATTVLVNKGSDDRGFEQPKELSGINTEENSVTPSPSPTTSLLPPTTTILPSITKSPTTTLSPTINSTTPTTAPTTILSPITIYPTSNVPSVELPTKSPTTAKPTTKTQTVSPTTTVMPTKYSTTTPTIISPTLSSATIHPTILPTEPPLTAGPTKYPTTDRPTRLQTTSPSINPTSVPTAMSTNHPMTAPPISPSGVPSSSSPTEPPLSPPAPSSVPSNTPTEPPVSPPEPSSIPSITPTLTLSSVPSITPTLTPSSVPSITPTLTPSSVPSITPTSIPTGRPTNKPTNFPTSVPTKSPTDNPTTGPTSKNTGAPTELTSMSFVANHLIENYNLSPESLTNPTTDEFRALDWVANQDGYYNGDVQQVDDIDKLVERFVIANFYFATNGPTDWDDRFDFLSDDSACEWNIGIDTSDTANGIFCNDDGWIEWFDLDDNGLSGTLPSTLGILTNLVALDLDINSLSGTVPTQWAALTNLEYLYLFDNDIRGNLNLIFCTGQQDWEDFEADCVSKIVCNCCTDCS